MHFVIENPQSWGVYIRRGDDEQIAEIFTNRKDAEKQSPDDHEEITNFVFWAKLEYDRVEKRPGNVTDWYLKDAQSRTLCKLTVSAADLLLKSLLNGQIKVNDEGQFEGMWTFKNWAGNVCCIPLSLEEEARLNINAV